MSSNTFDIDIKTLGEIVVQYEKRQINEEVSEIKRLGGLASIISVLKTHRSMGISNDPTDYNNRLEHFGSNRELKKESPSFWFYVWDALSDFMLRILLFVALIQLILGVTPISHDPKKDWIDGVAIIIAVLIVVFVSSVINYSKEKKFKVLNERNNEMNKVIVKRDNKIEEINPDFLVVGDLVKAKIGSILPADGLLVQASGFKVDESPLTGESDLIEKEVIETCDEICEDIKQVGSKIEKYTVPSPLLISGTLVKNGEGWYIVIAVGPNSAKGKIQHIVQGSQETNKTPLEIRLDEIAEHIGKFGILAAVFTLLALFTRFAVLYTKQKKEYNEYLNQVDSINLYNAQNPSRMLPFPRIKTEPNVSKLVLKNILLVVAIVVVAIPEGLPLAVTLSLAFSINKMMKDNNLVRKMHACETMGGANYICTDKTGTLTKNEMSVTTMFNCKQVINLECSKKLSILEYFSEEYFQLLSTSLSLNIEAEIDENDYFQNESKTDKSFIDFIHAFDTMIYPTRNKYQDKRIIPFSSQRKKMSVLVKHTDFPKGGRIILKGASEIVLESISKYYDAELNTIKLLTDSDKIRFQNIISQFANKALRTICIGYKDINENEFDGYQKLDTRGKFEIEEKDFIIIGIFGIKDTLRDNVEKSINICKTAGINVIMVTGDNKETAVAIAKECNIIEEGYDPKLDENDYTAMTGEEFYTLIEGVTCEICRQNTESCLCPKNKREALNRQLPESMVKKERIKNIQVFKKITKNLKVLARSRPFDKYTLVLGLKSLNKVIAVTGDGTNDAQALGKSDVGFAMGIQGTDIAKEAADIIILDDNFSSIVKAVKWGRNIYDNIRKFIQFQLSVNLCACLLVFITACIGNETPISAIQMLWINLIMDSLGSLALATEPPHPDLLKRHPIPKSEYIINYIMWKHIIFQALCLLGILLVLYLEGHKWIEEQEQYRILEADILYKCYGQYPGIEPKNGKYYVLSGSSIYWKADVYLKDNMSRIECGQYAIFPDLYQAYSNYTSAYGNTSHLTMIFNIFVYYTLFNELNARIINDKINIFERLCENKLFIVILIVECSLQALLVEFGSVAFNTSWKGLTSIQWVICIGISLITFPVAIILKVIPVENCFIAISKCFKNKVHAGDYDQIEESSVNEYHENDNIVILDNKGEQERINSNANNRSPLNSRRDSVSKKMIVNTIRKKSNHNFESNNLRKKKEDPVG